MPLSLSAGNRCHEHSYGCGTKRQRTEEPVLVLSECKADDVRSRGFTAS